MKKRNFVLLVGVWLFMIGGAGIPESQKEALLFASGALCILLFVFYFIKDALVKGAPKSSTFEESRPAGTE